MKLMTCPINGVRPISEFVYQGEVRSMPDPDQVSDVDWAAYVFNRSGVAGLKYEWWYHSPSGVWFIAHRNTVTDEVVQTSLYADWIKS